MGSRPSEGRDAIGPLRGGLGVWGGGHERFAFCFSGLQGLNSCRSLNKRSVWDVGNLRLVPGSPKLAGDISQVAQRSLPQRLP